jgi:hypothetical protein
MFKKVFNTKPEGTWTVERPIEMGRMCVAGHQNFGHKKLEECGTE